MVEAARHAHPARPVRRALTATGIALGLALGPRPGLAAPAAPAPSAAARSATAAEPTRATAPARSSSTADRGVGDSTAGEVAPNDDAPNDDAPNDMNDDAPNDANDDAIADEPADDASEPADDTADEGVADGEPADDDAADDDAADDAADEDTTDDDAAEPADAASTTPPLRPLQTAAWWTMFGAFAVGTTAGVLAGLAERQEDRATRLSSLFDSSTGAQPLYADRQDEYEGYLRRGRAYASAAIGVGVVSGVATLTAITLFAIDARRQRRERDQAPGQRARSRPQIRPQLGGMEVRF